MASRRALVIGVGNVSRRDDGLGWCAVNVLRERLGLRRLGEFDDGLDDVGHEVDCVVVPQLTPELAETAAPYDLLIVVDARVTGADGVLVEEASALSVGARLLSHQLSVADLVGLCRVLYGRSPVAHLVTARGRDYDFAVGLSPAMAALLPDVVAAVERLMYARALTEV